MLFLFLNKRSDEVSVDAAGAMLTHTNDPKYNLLEPWLLFVA